MTAPMFPRPIAHRGLHDRSAGVIENSAAAFEAAIAGNFAIECDLQLTSDGVAVVFHDPDRKRLQGVDGAVADTTSAEMTATSLLDGKDGKGPQTLAQFLEQIAGRTLLQIELKHQRDAASTDTLARVTAEHLAAYQGPVTVESFDPDLIRLVRDHGFSGLRGIITFDYEPNDWTAHLSDDERYRLKHLLHWHETQFDFISCAKDALDMPAVRFWRELGKPVTAWTIKSHEEARDADWADQIVFEGFDPDA